MPVFFIRHGQSEFNAVHKDGDNDPLIFDAPLTDKGRRQAEEARSLVADLGIKQVITSPLTRAIQTALCIFDGIAPINHHQRCSATMGTNPAICGLVHHNRSMRQLF